MWLILIYSLFVCWGMYLLGMLLLALFSRMGFASQKRNELFQPQVTVLLPFRNESTGIIACAKTLLQQAYPAQKMDILFVNDHSEDDSEEKISAFLRSSEKNISCSVFSLPETAQGKRAAIQAGVNRANGEIILTVDADCLYPPYWLQTMLNGFSENTKMTFGPVCQPGKHFLGQLFALEHLSLQAMAYALAAVNMPSYASGASMAFCKEAYLILANKIGGKELLWGDDVFTLHAFKKKYKKCITPVFCPENLVIASAPETALKQFKQRVRWFSKAGHYTDGHTRLVMWVSGFVHLSVFLILPIVWLMPHLATVCLLFLLLKALIEFTFLFLGAKQVRMFGILKVFLPAFLAYPFYMLALSFAALFLDIRWKGRKVQQ